MNDNKNKDFNDMRKAVLDFIGEKDVEEKTNKFYSMKIDEQSKKKEKVKKEKEVKEEKISEKDIKNVKKAIGIGGDSAKKKKNKRNAEIQTKNKVFMKAKDVFKKPIFRKSPMKLIALPADKIKLLMPPELRNKKIAKVRDKKEGSLALRVLKAVWIAVISLFIFILIFFFCVLLTK